MKNIKFYIILLIILAAGACSEDSSQVQAPGGPEDFAALSSAGTEYRPYYDPGDVSVDQDGQIGLPIDPPGFSPEEAQVIDNCRTLQRAVELFARLTGGLYPWDPYYDETPEGWTVVDLLPMEMRLENPYTKERNQPTRLNAVSQGQTGYVRYYERVDGVKHYGYMINGFGENEEICLILRNFPEDRLDFVGLIIDNCYKVQLAAEIFAAENNGVYPGGLADKTMSGHTMIDYLPEGRCLVNPYTFWRTEPVGAPAATPGQTGYVVRVDNSGTNAGYSITGFGRAELIEHIYR